MNNVAQYYRQLVTSLTERLQNGERDIDTLVQDARATLEREGKLTDLQIEQLTHSVRRDLHEFARHYTANHQASALPAEDTQDESVFMRIIKESLWKELADMTDKTQLEWKEVLKDVNHHGIYHSGEVVGLGNLVCEKCHFTLAVYTPEILSKCPECGHTDFTRKAFEP
ncbi:zinc ribbon-containing protein [Ewingella americana]|jgi:rubrerythrin|uniref:Zinc ribbon-containing protein n=1 Tax=Ewingella americana TaxID=41202 RepID=A0A502GSN0_9GAMM|nr:zinc ribbon-containing protein [Ewingella americana]TPG63996.1 zinc ribbon-containing protein [Ewingella americana]